MKPNEMRRYDIRETIKSGVFVYEAPLAHDGVFTTYSDALAAIETARREEREMMNRFRAEVAELRAACMELWQKSERRDPDSYSVPDNVVWRIGTAIGQARRFPMPPTPATTTPAGDET